MSDWHPMTDIAWHDGRDVVLLANDMEVQARFCPGEWSHGIDGSEYDGPVWSCFDDAFQIEIEETSPYPAEWFHESVTYWRELTPRIFPAASAPIGLAQGHTEEASVRRETSL